MNGLFLWASGYTARATQRASEADREHLGKVGGVVLFVAAWTGGLWALASLLWLPTEELWTRAAIASLCGFVGFSLILVVDRSGVYAQDARPSSATTTTWLIFRIVLVLAVGVFTSEKLVPLFLRAELEEQALVEREASDAQRDAALRVRFQTAEVQQRLDRRESEVKQLESERRLVPAEIRAAMDQALSCRRAANERKTRLLSAGTSEVDARLAVGPSLIRCHDIDRKAAADLKEHREEMARRLAVSRQQASSLRAMSDTAMAEIQERTTTARGIEKQSVTRFSARVMWVLITHNMLAAVKVLALFIISLSVETLPFLFKAFIGRTALGAGLAAERAIGVLEADSELACRRHESAMRVAASAAVVDAINRALETESVQASMAQFAAQQAAALAPMEIAIQTLRAAERHKSAFDSIAKRVPDLTGFAYRLWTEAMLSAARSARGATP